MPDVHIPETTLAVLQWAAASGPEAGMDLAAALAAQVKPMVKGLLIAMPGS